MSANHESVGPDGQPVAGIHLGYSDDGGDTWHLGASAGGAAGDIFVNESTLVELTDGRIYVNVREAGTAEGTRAYAISSDGGDSYDAPFQMVPELTMPVVQGALLRLTATDEGDARDRILFSGPANPGKREALTIRSSFDEARSVGDLAGRQGHQLGPGRILRPGRDRDRSGHRSGGRRAVRRRRGRPVRSDPVRQVQRGVPRHPERFAAEPAAATGARTDDPGRGTALRQHRLRARRRDPG